jgi:hypothetical protein
MEKNSIVHLTPTYLVRVLHSHLMNWGFGLVV